MVLNQILMFLIEKKELKIQRVRGDWAKKMRKKNLNKELENDIY